MSRPNKSPPSHADRNALRQSIEAAFEPASLPAADQITAPDLLAHAESSALTRAFAGQHWRQIEPETVAAEYDALSFFTPAAFRYYLPAFLLATLSGRGRAGNAGDSVLVHLDPPRDAVRLARFRRVATGFTTAQHGAIREYLEYMRAVHTVGKDQIGHALKAFWASHR